MGRGKLVLGAAVVVVAGLLVAWLCMPKHHSQQPRVPKSQMTAAAATFQQQYKDIEKAINSGNVAAQASVVSQTFRDEFAGNNQPMLPQGTTLFIDAKTFRTQDGVLYTVEARASNGEKYTITLLNEDGFWKIVSTEVKK